MTGTRRPYLLALMDINMTLGEVPAQCVPFNKGHGRKPA